MSTGISEDSEDYYKRLYLKYKSKYLKLRGGGVEEQCPMMSNVGINDLEVDNKYRYLGRRKDRIKTILQYKRPSKRPSKNGNFYMFKIIRNENDLDKLKLEKLISIPITDIELLCKYTDENNISQCKTYEKKSDKVNKWCQSEIINTVEECKKYNRLRSRVCDIIFNNMKNIKNKKLNNNWYINQDVNSEIKELFNVQGVGLNYGQSYVSAYKETDKYNIFINFIKDKDIDTRQKIVILYEKFNDIISRVDKIPACIFLDNNFLTLYICKSTEIIELNINDCILFSVDSNISKTIRCETKYDTTTKDFRCEKLVKDFGPNILNSLSIEHECSQKNKIKAGEKTPISTNSTNPTYVDIQPTNSTYLDITPTNSTNPTYVDIQPTNSTYLDITPTNPATHYSIDWIGKITQFTTLEINLKIIYKYNNSRMCIKKPNFKIFFTNENLINSIQKIDCTT